MWGRGGWGGRQEERSTCTQPPPSPAWVLPHHRSCHRCKGNYSKGETTTNVAAVAGNLIDETLMIPVGKLGHRSYCTIGSHCTIGNCCSNNIGCCRTPNKKHTLVAFQKILNILSFYLFFYLKKKITLWTSAWVVFQWLLEKVCWKMSPFISWCVTCKPKHEMFSPHFQMVLRSACRTLMHAECAVSYT